MTRFRKPASSALLYASLALGLAALVLAASSPPARAQTQTPTFKIDGFYSGLPQVYEGSEVQFRVTGTGVVFGTDVTVVVETWEPNLEDGNGNNPSLQTHPVRFRGHIGLTPTRDFSVTAYVDGVDESAEASHVLKARLVASSDGSYAVDTRNEFEYTILDPPEDVPRISIASDSIKHRRGRRGDLHPDPHGRHRISR